MCKKMNFNRLYGFSDYFMVIIRVTTGFLCPEVHRRSPYGTCGDGSISPSIFLEVLFIWQILKRDRQREENRSPAAQFDLLAFENDGFLKHCCCVGKTCSPPLNARLISLVN